MNKYYYFVTVMLAKTHGHVR